MRMFSGHSVSGLRALTGIAAISLVVGGSVIAGTAISDASPAIAPAVPPSSHPIPKVTSLPSDCPSGHLYQPGGPLCIDGVRIRSAPVGWPAKKAEIFYGEEELAATGIGKPLRQPYVAPNAPGMIKEPNGTYARVSINLPRSGEISTAPPDNRIPPIVETSMWNGWSGNVVDLVQAGTDIATGNAAVLVTTQVETQEVTPNSGVYGPGPFNGEVFVSPKVKGDLKVISESGNIVTLQLMGTAMQYHFNVDTDTFVS